MKAKSIKGSSPEEIEKALEQSMESNYKPTLAFVFTSIKQDIDRVCQLFDKKGIAVFGATSCGEFIDGDIGTGTIAVLLLDVDPSHFSILLEDYRDKDPLAITGAMANKAKQQFNNPSFLISIGINVPNAAGLGEPVLRAIEDVAGKEVVIWGGRAADDHMFTDTIVFTNQLSTNRGILLLALDGDKILIKGQAASGQISVGTEKTITKATENWIYEIDHQPATDMIIKFLGLNLTSEEAESFLAPFILFSLSRDKGDPVMRSLGQFNWQTKAVVNLGNIKEGEKIRLTLPPDFEIIEEVSRNAEQVRQEEMPDPDALLMFSCAGRLEQLGPMIGDEIEGVRKVFSVPMAGFFTYGEFGRTNHGNNEFHNNTCCWVALKETGGLAD
jgi:hypothetical protein